MGRNSLFCQCVQAAGVSIGFDPGFPNLGVAIRHPPGKPSELVFAERGYFAFYFFKPGHMRILL